MSVAFVVGVVVFHVVVVLGVVFGRGGCFVVVGLFLAVFSCCFWDGISGGGGLSVYLKSVCLPARLSVCLSVCLSLCLNKKCLILIHFIRTKYSIWAAFFFGSVLLMLS